MRIGSLFSGAGGLDLAVQEVFGGEVVWHSEIDKAASKVLAYRFPGVPNLGSVTEIDWAAVEPVDVLCGGFPCQDVSAAGKRAGIKDGTRSGLWSVFVDAIDHLRPPIVIIENVRGLLSATAHRSVEPADGVVGNGAGGPVLRAAGAVLGDLADLGYDAQWTTAAASEVGAPHRRERVFILAADTAQQQGFIDNRNDVCAGWPSRRQSPDTGRGSTTDTSVGGWDARLPESEGQRRQPVSGPSGDCTESEVALLLPTPTASQGRNETSGRQPGSKHNSGTTLNDVVFKGEISSMLPTPRATDGTDGPVTNCPSVQAICDGSAGRAPRLSEMAAGYLLPTPNAQDGNGGGRYSSDGHQRTLPGEARLLPTPQARDFKGTDSAADHNRRSPGMDAVTHHFPALSPTPEAKNSHAGPDYARMNREGSGGHDLVTALTLLCTPTAQPGTSRSGNRIGEPLLKQQAREMKSSWGKYAPAIHRWENATRPAPPPTEPNKNGNPRLSAEFSQWLMGWPEGWVTDPAIGISRNDQLRIVGNGVCPQQAVAALAWLLRVAEIAA